MGLHRYAVYDVFTDTPLAGNPLAVVWDAEALDDRVMQRVAREFNLSETVFVLPPRDPAHRARIRIFTPDYEMPFAGHPTVGSAVALAAAEAGGAGSFILEEEIGPVRCAVEWLRGVAFAEFELPKLPERIAFDADDAAVSHALGLSPEELGFGRHGLAGWSAGVPYVLVPVATPDALARARFDNAAWMMLAPRKSPEAVASAYLYTRQAGSAGAGFRARMFVPGLSSYEDPATGSAAAAFAGQVLACDRPPDGSSRVWIEQGVEMGRPSRIRLDLDVEGGTLRTARIGGNAVKVAEGKLLL